MSFAARQAPVGASGLVFLPKSILSASLMTAPFLSVNSNGSLFTSTSFGSTSFTWLLSGAASDYEVRFSIGNQSPSDFSGPALGTWLSLASNRQWTYIGFLSESCLLEIRKASPASILASSDATFFWNP
jgi:hypothetical protein